MYTIEVHINGENRKIKCNAAHSSGNLCLIAYDNDKWHSYQSGRAEKPQGFVFLKNTDYYRTMNATMNMSKWINDADCNIDGNIKCLRLRKKGNSLINRSSIGEITPDQGIVEYLQEALGEVKEARRRLEEKNKTIEVQKVLEYYEKYLSKIENIIKKRYYNFRKNARY